MNEVIGILGGTFDPVHNGHLRLAEAALNTYALDRVIFIPAARPPHKDRPDILAGEIRLEMLRIAIDNMPDFEISALELNRKGRSYTIDTLRDLQSKIPTAKLRLIMGADMLPELHLWRDAREVVSLGNPIVAVRPGTLTSAAEVAEYVAEEFCDLVPIIQDGFLPMPPCPISSTLIREHCRTAKSIAHLVPEGVARYIAAHNLYT